MTERARKIAQVYELICELATDEPTRVVPKRGDQCLILELCPPRAEVGKLVGKEGRTAEALRRLGVVVGRADLRVVVEILEPED